MDAAGQGDHLMAVGFDPNLKKFSGNPPAPFSQSSEVFAAFGTPPMVSAQGIANGVVWTLDVGSDTFLPQVPVILRAYGAGNLATKPYEVASQPWAILTQYPGQALGLARSSAGRRGLD